MDCTQLLVGDGACGLQYLHHSYTRTHPGFQWRLHRHRVRDLNLGRLHDYDAKQPVRRGPLRYIGCARWPSASPRNCRSAGNGCGTVVINSENSQDQVTDETITYALPACEFTGVFGVDSLAITGTLELMHPNPSVFAFSSRLRIWNSPSPPPASPAVRRATAPVSSPPPAASPVNRTT